MYDNRKRPAEWIDRGSFLRYFPKPSLHTKEVLLTVWWSQAELIHHGFLPTDETITDNKYRTQIEEIIKKLAVICPAMVNRKTPMLLHDNAMPHVAQQTLGKLNDLKIETVPHPRYYRDLSPLDYFLSGKLLKNKNSPIQVFQEFLASRTSDFHQTGILKLVSRSIKIKLF